MRRCSSITTWWRSSVAALLLAGLTACGTGGPRFKGTDITGAHFGKDFALTDQTGRLRRLEDFRGKVVLLFFGYTHCTDVCPTTLAELAQVRRGLGREAARVQVLFVTLDPERDTRAVLGRYVAAFDPSFLGLRGDPETIRRTAEEFKIYYRKVPGATPGSYSLDHSSQTYVYDTRGRLRLFERAGEITADLPHDLRVLLAERKK